MTYLNSMLHAFNDAIDQNLIVGGGKGFHKFGEGHRLLFGLQENTTGGIALLTERLIIMVASNE